MPNPSPLEFTATARGHGKLILAGEHSVVYGYPALALSLERGAQARLFFKETESQPQTLTVAIRHISDGAIAEVPLTLDEVFKPFEMKPNLDHTQRQISEHPAAPTAESDLDSVEAKTELRSTHRFVEAFKALAGHFPEILPLLRDPKSPCSGRSLRLEIIIEIPVGAGLGSSAAMAVASARAFDRLVLAFPFVHRGLTPLPSSLAPTQADGESRLQNAVHASETIFHRRASGIDQAAAFGNQFFRFQRQDAQIRLDLLPSPELALVVAQAAPSAPTSDMVERVARFQKQYPSLAQPILQTMGSLVEVMQRRLADHHLEDERLKETGLQEVGELMNLNHKLLGGLGVSSKVLDQACQAALDAGALGAKLTGAGGGGCMVALCRSEQQHVISEALQAQNWPTVSV